MCASAGFLRDSGRNFQKYADRNTNVFPAKTGQIVGINHKNQIKLNKNRENADAFVKLTKIGIEIRKPFVYNVFIAASRRSAVSLEGGAFPKGD